MLSKLILLFLLVCSIASYASVNVPRAIIAASSDVLKNASVSTAVYPKYPEEALENKVDGKVMLAFVINELGRANDVQVLYSQPQGVFDQTAKVALSLWEFRAATSESIGCGYAKQGAVVMFGFNHAEEPRSTTIKSFGVINNQNPDPKESREQRSKLERELKAIRRVEPDYPRSAARVHAEGLVVLKFSVTKEGNVEDIEVIQAVPIRGFTRVARNAVDKWKFEPVIKDGKAVKQRVCQTIKFQISDEGKITEISSPQDG